MTHEERIRLMSIDEIVNTHNDFVDPFEFSLPYIKPNDEDALDEIAEVMSGSWLVKAIRNGYYNPMDKYIIALTESDEIQTFSTPKQFFDHIAQPKDLAQFWYGEIEED